MKPESQRLLPLERKTAEPVTDWRVHFERWKQRQPLVWGLVQRAFVAAANRLPRFGIGLVCERVRWQMGVEWGWGDEIVKINHNHRAYMARELIRRYPEHRDKLRFRQARDSGEGSQ